jgi:hypothetical protein
MVRRIVIVAAWSVAGVALTVALIGGGFVLAGTTLTEPAAPIRVSVSTLIPRPSASRGDADIPSPGGAGATPTGGVQPTGASPPPSHADDAVTSGGDGGPGEREVAGDD